MTSHSVPVWPCPYPLSFSRHTPKPPALPTLKEVEKGVHLWNCFLPSPNLKVVLFYSELGPSSCSTRINKKINVLLKRWKRSPRSPKICQTSGLQKLRQHSKASMVILTNPWNQAPIPFISKWGKLHDQGEIDLPTFPDLPAIPY